MGVSAVMKRDDDRRDIAFTSHLFDHFLPSSHLSDTFYLEDLLFIWRLDASLSHFPPIPETRCELFPGHTVIKQNRKAVHKQQRYISACSNKTVTPR